MVLFGGTNLENWERNALLNNDEQKNHAYLKLLSLGSTPHTSSKLSSSSVTSNFQTSLDWVFLEPSSSCNELLKLILVHQTVKHQKRRVGIAITFTSMSDKSSLSCSCWSDFGSLGKTVGSLTKLTFLFKHFNTCSSLSHVDWPREYITFDNVEMKIEWGNQQRLTSLELERWIIISLTMFSSPTFKNRLYKNRRTDQGVWGTGSRATLKRWD